MGKCPRQETRVRRMRQPCLPFLGPDPVCGRVAGGAAATSEPDTCLSLSSGPREREEVDAADLPPSDAPKLFIKCDRQHECANSL